MCRCKDVCCELMKMMQQGDAALAGVWVFFFFFFPSDEEKLSRQPRETERVYLSQVSARTRFERCMCRVQLHCKKKNKKCLSLFFNFFLKQNCFYTWVEIIFGSGEQIITSRLIYVFCSIPTLSESGLD